MPPVTLTLYAKFDADAIVDTFLADVHALASATFVACTSVTCKHDCVKSQHTVTFSCAMSGTDDERLTAVIGEYQTLVPRVVELALQACPGMTRGASGALELGSP